MAFSIKDPEIDKNLRFLSSLTGESLTEAVGSAIIERIEKVNAERVKLKNNKRKNLQKFLEKRKAVSPDQYNHKKMTDDIWGQ